MDRRSFDAERALMMMVAWHYLGTPYIWGGDDPSGLDCSGFAIECLQSVGILQRKGDWTAAVLQKMFSACPVTDDPLPGDLVFYGNEAGQVVHIEIMVDTKRAIGASGGGSANINVAEAWKRNAYVKVRPIATRGGLHSILDPFLADALQKAAGKIKVT